MNKDKLKGALIIMVSIAVIVICVIISVRFAKWHPEDAMTIDELTVSSDTQVNYTDVVKCADNDDIAITVSYAGDSTFTKVSGDYRLDSGDAVINFEFYSYTDKLKEYSESSEFDCFDTFVANDISYDMYSSSSDDRILYFIGKVPNGSYISGSTDSDSGHLLSELIMISVHNNG